MSVRLRYVGDRCEAARVRIGFLSILNGNVCRSNVQNYRVTRLATTVFIYRFCFTSGGGGSLCAVSPSSRFYQEFSECGEIMDTLDKYRGRMNLYSTTRAALSLNNHVSKK